MDVDKLVEKRWIRCGYHGGKPVDRGEQKGDRFRKAQEWKNRRKAARGFFLGERGVFRKPSFKIAVRRQTEKNTTAGYKNLKTIFENPVKYPDKATIV